MPDHTVSHDTATTYAVDESILKITSSEAAQKYISDQNVSIERQIALAMDFLVLNKGQRGTVTEVTELTGLRVNRNTVAEHMKQWYTHLRFRQFTSTGIPEVLVTAFADLWSQAQSTAANRFEDDKQRLEQAAGAAIQARIEIEQRLKSAEADIESLQKRSSELDVENQKLSEKLAETQQLLNSARSESMHLTKDNERLEAASEHNRTEMKLLQDKLSQAEKALAVKDAQIARLEATNLGLETTLTAKDDTIAALRSSSK
ncbi:hypothetical protein C4K68_22635 [Pokkaliibacter plantistimulans]|uniref:KfrA N-terminal DNA-binding domain-containing protein n=1 Tax=Proteobacteria bacterium 228 TaxID=2083153 RepID=A0A2S5KL34_9PROT|nr:DNA-binding protein [Pokkaliibacter plantistimulans]PPC75026.1 hypothetical protein C4K68_22635 [Pokkaliibacter plantistimulans]